MGSNKSTTITVENNKEVEELLLTGVGMSVGMCIYDKYKNVEMIVNDTKFPLLRVKLVLNKFIDLGIIDALEKRNTSGVIEKYYKLAPSRLDFVYDRKTIDITAMISFINEETSKILHSIGNGVGIGNAKHISIKANKKDMMQFIKELELLIERYEDLEDPVSEEIYSFISVIGRSS